MVTVGTRIDGQFKVFTPVVAHLLNLPGQSGSDVPESRQSGPTKVIGPT